VFLVRCPDCGSRLIQPLDVASPIRGSSIVARSCPECGLRDAVVADDAAIQVWLRRDGEIRAWLGDLANALASQTSGGDAAPPPAPATRPRRAARELATGNPAFAVSSALQVVAWNAPLERLTGRRAHDAIGRSCREIMTSISYGLPPSCCAAHCPLLERQQSPSDGDVDFELETRFGARPATLATILAAGHDLLHVVQTPPH
jgi:hypothetical protein